MDKLIDLAAEIFDIDKKEISVEKDRDEIQNWDSLAHVRLIAAIDEIFGVNIPFNEVDKIRKLSDFQKFLAAKI